MSPVPAPEPVDPGGGLVLVGIPDEGDSVVFTSGQWVPGAGGGGADLSDYLGDTSAPLAEWGQGTGAFTAPGTTIGDVGVGWWQIDYTSGFNWLVGTDDLTPAGSCIVNINAQTGVAFIATYAYNANHEFEMRTQDTFAQFTGRAAAGQTQPLIRLVDISNNPLFAVGATGALDLTEQTAPAAPDANTARIYTKDVGGKTGLYVLFPSGAEQQIKVEA